MITTPAKQDKRLWLTAAVVGAVLVLTALGHEPGAQVLEFLGVVCLGYSAQSQWGQTKRATATK